MKIVIQNLLIAFPEFRKFLKSKLLEALDDALARPVNVDFLLSYSSLFDVHIYLVSTKKQLIGRVGERWIDRTYMFLGDNTERVIEALDRLDPDRSRIGYFAVISVKTRWLGLFPVSKELTIWTPASGSTMAQTLEKLQVLAYKNIRDEKRRLQPKRFNW